jgi:hypothetical protein
MAAILGVLILVLLVGLFWLFRSMGSMGQQPSAGERIRHNGSEGNNSGPRATGLN